MGPFSVLLRPFPLLPPPPPALSRRHLRLLPLRLSFRPSRAAAPDGNALEDVLADAGQLTGDSRDGNGVSGSVAFRNAREQAEAEAIDRACAHGTGNGLAVSAAYGDGSLPDLNENRGKELGTRLDTEAPSNIWKQMKEIAVFAGPATGLWICGPLMSLIDTAVIGQGSSLELAALGPGTVFCDYLCYIFMFLSIATSNMVATSLAKKDRSLVQHQISMLLFIAFSTGMGMLLFTKFLGPKVLAGFIGTENMHLVPAAKTYVQIRGFAWPAVLVGMVAQSASLGMKDSWGPLKALTMASLINGFGDILLCCVLGYGIAGAAWATMISQIVAAYMMIDALKKRGYTVYSLSIPSASELLQVVELAAPVFITMTSKVAFYSLLTYFATTMGTVTVAAHQVMINVYCMCTVWGEPLSQTAQSFMPELILGIGRSLRKARMLLKSLVIIGAVTGVTLGAVGTLVPWIFPQIFTADELVRREMHKVLVPYFVALMVTPATHSLEGTLLAGRDLRFLSLSMSGCFTFGGFLLALVCGRGFGLPGCWWALAGFQWARFSLALKRLTSPNGMLYSEEFYQHKYVKPKVL